MSNDERLDEIRQEIAGWARRPPSRTPETVRRTVLRRLGDRRRGRRPGWHWAAAAAGLVMVLGLGILMARPELARHRAAQERSPASAVRESEGMLVYKLRSGATLYLPLGSGGPAASGEASGDSVEGEPR